MSPVILMLAKIPRALEQTRALRSMRRLLVLFLVLVALGAEAQAQEWRPQPIRIVPAPESHPLFARVAALLPRDGRSAAPLELTTQALPTLERACKASGDTACVQWTTNQRQWREEIERLKQSIGACRPNVQADPEYTRRLYGAQYMDYGRSYEQQLRDQAIFERRLGQQIQAAEDAASGCAGGYVARLRALQFALVGRDLSAEVLAFRERSRAEALTGLTTAATAIVNLGDSPPDEQSAAARASLKTWTMAADQNQDAKAAAGPLILAADALMAGWAVEATHEDELLQATRERDRARNTVRERPTEIRA